MQAGLHILLLLILQIAVSTPVKSPLGRSHIGVIDLLGSDYKKLNEGGGPVIQFKKSVKGDPVLGNYDYAEFVYFERDTCVKDVMILPARQLEVYVDSFNRIYKTSGYHAWFAADSSFISVSLTDGFLDVTSFSAAYYKKISGH
jgi:hypothetical protein